jgi:uncharacterized protein with NRDE domain
MCLVLVAWRQHDKFPLIIAGNRDEFHARPTERLHWWADHDRILGGRDLQAGGTWLASGRDGRFAVITNYRDAIPPDGAHRSRGELVVDFVDGASNPIDYANAIDQEAYAGFNLFVCDGETLAYVSNRDGQPRELEPGLYGVANAGLDAPWHKTLASKKRMRDILDGGAVNEQTLIDMLGDRERGPAGDVNTHGLDFELAHALTAPFVVQPEYGTRASTVVLLSTAGKVDVVERRFLTDGSVRGETHETYQVE